MNGKLGVGGKGRI